MSDENADRPDQLGKEDVQKSESPAKENNKRDRSKNKAAQKRKRMQLLAAENPDGILAERLRRQEPTPPHSFLAHPKSEAITDYVVTTVRRALRNGDVVYGGNVAKEVDAIFGRARDSNGAIVTLGAQDFAWLKQWTNYLIRWRALTVGGKYRSGVDIFAALNVANSISPENDPAIQTPRDTRASGQAGGVTQRDDRMPPDGDVEEPESSDLEATLRGFGWNINPEPLENSPPLKRAEEDRDQREASSEDLPSNICVDRGEKFQEQSLFDAPSLPLSTDEDYLAAIGQADSGRYIAFKFTSLANQNASDFWRAYWKSNDIADIRAKACAFAADKAAVKEVRTLNEPFLRETFRKLGIPLP